MSESVSRRPEAHYFLQMVNLRPEEAERTLFMFLFYGATSIGAVWLEYSSSAMFLESYKSENLNWVYIATAFAVTAFGIFYSWLQRHFPLRWVMLGVSMLLALPLPVAWLGLLQDKKLIWHLIAVFMVRLWVEGIYVLSSINNDIAANQLFNIREIKRAFPLISTGIIIAEIFGGFSYSFLSSFIGTANVVLPSCGMLFAGSMVLLFISFRYKQAFPNTIYSETDDEVNQGKQRIQDNLRHYISLLFGFFIAGHALFFLIDFQYQSQLEINLIDEAKISRFLGIFGGIMGIFKLILQLFGSSRIIENIGVFFAVLMPPIGLIITGVIAVLSPFGALISFCILKFCDELFRFTIVATTAPTLFQAIPDQMRSQMQSFVRGIAEPLSTGGTGVLIWLVSIALNQRGIGKADSLPWFAMVTICLSMVWIAIIWLLRRGYLELLIQSVGRGQLTVLAVDMRELRRAVMEALVRAETETDKLVCIDLLTQIAPQSVGETLAPMLLQLSPELQRRSLEAMLLNPEKAYLRPIQTLMTDLDVTPVVQALCLRYRLLADESNQDLSELRQYLGADQDPMIRSTAVALMMRLGTSGQVAEATNTLRHMLTSASENDRILGCRALAEATYMQSLRFYVPQLLQDRSIEVRCALLKAIAATRTAEYFPSLLRGLYYKSTRKAAYDALVVLGDDAIEPLIELAQQRRAPAGVRLKAWEILGAINTFTSLSLLANHLRTSWGKERRTILQTLLKVPAEAGVEITLENFGRNGIEAMILQELRIMGEAWSAELDIPESKFDFSEAALLRDSLQSEIQDCLERSFLLMKFLYTPSAIQAAAFNILAGSKSSIAKGMEILDNTIDLSIKQTILYVVDQRAIIDKIQVLHEIHTYTPLSGIERLCEIIEKYHCFSDWTLACCFHVARSARWSIPAELTLQCLEHPAGFVREAVMAYLQVASPRSLQRMLPVLMQDRDPLVSTQAQAIARYFGSDTSGTPPFGGQPLGNQSGN